MELAFEEAVLARQRTLRILRITLLLGGIWNLSGCVFYSVLIGRQPPFQNPPIHPFYALFIGSFLLSLAYLQFASARHIERSLANIGPVVLARLLYAGLLWGHMLGTSTFPKNFFWTGLGDALWSCWCILVPLVSKGLPLREIFWPSAPEPQRTDG